jgi:hypothetical protein
VFWIFRRSPTSSLRSRDVFENLGEFLSLRVVKSEVPENMYRDAHAWPVARGPGHVEEQKTHCRREDCEGEPCWRVEARHARACSARNAARKPSVPSAVRNQCQVAHRASKARTAESERPPRSNAAFANAKKIG